MAKIPLRAYNTEIEKLIENKQSPEAVAHCKHILKYFPKHIDTYRLLGKAYLEMHRYSEAADILQRVLSVIPDDFLSQIGMSLVREDEGNLDAALYHMERAFEVHPANPAVQDELRRIYGQRDGVEPPKIRLTRGALVRMYARGELYQQAIAEARAALAEDPQRVDIQVLLARMYYLSGQKVQAAELCSKLVAHLPYCYEANRILADVLPGSSLAEDAKVYQERLQALDPYTGMTGDANRSVADVSDNAVQVDRLDYQPGQEEAAQPDWARNVGVAWESSPSTETLPDWMSGVVGQAETGPQAGAGTESFEDAPADAEIAAEIPDWMAAAGWSPSDGVETPPTAGTFDEVSAETEDALPIAADIPDWLQAMQPGETDQTEGEGGEDSAWLDGLLGEKANDLTDENHPVVSELEAQAPQATVEGLPEWLEGEPAAEDLTTAAPAEIPDWLQDAGEAVGAVTLASEVPDWLKDQPVDTERSQPEAEVTSDLPEWLKEQPVDSAAAQSETVLVSEVPDWLQDQPVDTVETQSEAALASEVPDWLQDQVVDQAENLPETVAASDVPEWLKDQPVEEVSTSLDVPDWLKDEPIELGAQNVTEELSTAEAAVMDHEAEIVALEASEEAAQPQPEDDMEAAMAWLESLAAKQGAQEGTLSTPVDERSEAMPDWLKQDAATEAELASESPLDAVAENADVESVTGLVEPLEQIVYKEVLEAETEEPTAELEPVALDSMAVPDIVQAVETVDDATQPTDITHSVETPAPEEPVSLVSESASTESEFESISPGDDYDMQSAEDGESVLPVGVENDMDDAFAWLEGLAARQGAEEGTLLGEDVVRPEQPPEWVSREIQTEAAETASEVEETPLTLEASGGLTDLPEAVEPIVEKWSEPQAVEPDVEAVAQVSQEPQVEAEVDLPDWLQDIDAYTRVEDVDETETDAEELPDWLQGLEGIVEYEEASSEVTTLPLAADWKPEESSVLENPVELEKVTELEAMLKELEAQSDTEQEAVAGVPTPPIEKQVVAEAATEASEIPEGTPPDGLLESAQNALAKGEIENALLAFNRLIADENHLEETIHDLRDASYRYPVNSDIWQALGDAYSRSNRIQEALDAYTKAEELLR